MTHIRGSQTSVGEPLVPDDGQRRLAVLIDADNAQASAIENLLGEIARYGVASVRRIYGDCTRPNLAGWKEALLQQCIQTIQQFTYTKGMHDSGSDPARAYELAMRPSQFEVYRGQLWK